MRPRHCRQGRNQEGNPKNGLGYPTNHDDVLPAIILGESLSPLSAVNA